jgi:hypothetical protein
LAENLIDGIKAESVFQYKKYKCQAQAKEEKANEARDSHPTRAHALHALVSSSQ